MMSLLDVVQENQVVSLKIGTPMEKPKFHKSNTDIYSESNGTSSSSSCIEEKSNEGSSLPTPSSPSQFSSTSVALNTTQNSSVHQSSLKSDKSSSLFKNVTEEAKATYTHIEENVYKDTGGFIDKEDSMPCLCKFDPDQDSPNMACGDESDCINRSLFIECTPDDCPCGQYCRNQRFLQKQWAKIEIFKTEKKGYGVYAGEPLSSGQFVMEYCGEVISQVNFIKRTQQYSDSGRKHFYFMSLQKDEVIDATQKGNLSRFLNHSCNPNCALQKWIVGDRLRIGIFTIKSLKAGEELTFDYKFERYGSTAQKCYCEEFNCKGFIGGARKSELLDVQSVEDNLSEEGSDIEGPIESRKSKQIKNIKSDDEFDGYISAKKLSPQGIAIEDVPRFVKNMLYSTTKPSRVSKLLKRLEVTESAFVLRRFIQFHGLLMLKSWLRQFKSDLNICRRILRVMKNLPIGVRNTVQDSGLEAFVTRFIDHPDEEIVVDAKQIIEKWMSLKIVYKIPKLKVIPKQIESNSVTSTATTPISRQSSCTELSSTLTSGQSASTNPSKPQSPNSQSSVLADTRTKHESSGKNYQPPTSSSLKGIRHNNSSRHNDYQSRRRYSPSGDSHSYRPSQRRDTSLSPRRRCSPSPYLSSKSHSIKKNSNSPSGRSPSIDSRRHAPYTSRSDRSISNSPRRHSPIRNSRQSSSYRDSLPHSHRRRSPSFTSQRNENVRRSSSRRSDTSSNDQSPRRGRGHSTSSCESDRNGYSRRNRHFKYHHRDVDHRSSTSRRRYSNTKSGRAPSYDSGTDDDRYRGRSSSLRKRERRSYGRRYSRSRSISSDSRSDSISSNSSRDRSRSRSRDRSKSRSRDRKSRGQSRSRSRGRRKSRSKSESRGRSTSSTYIPPAQRSRKYSPSFDENETRPLKRHRSYSNESARKSPFVSNDIDSEKRNRKEKDEQDMNDSFNRSNIKASTSVIDTDIKKSPSEGDQDILVLPPNWKQAHSTDGHIYFYNVKTGITQWNIPKVDDSPEKEHSTIGTSKQFSLEDSKTSIHNNGMTKLKLDNMTEKEKAIATKALREGISSIVVKFMSPKREKWGTERFKKLARKVTHLCVEKELRSKNPSLVMTEEIKNKVRKFVVSFVDKLERKEREIAEKRNGGQKVGNGGNASDVSDGDDSE